MVDALPAARANLQAHSREDALRLPQEIERLLTDAIKRGVDDALKASGSTLSAPREHDIVQRVSRDVTVEFQRTMLGSYQGPIPPPHMLEEFERVLPGLSAQIVAMAISEQRHRQKWENKALWNDTFMQSGGLTLGWVLAGASLVGAFALAMAGKTVEMGIFLSVPAILMIRSIINGGQPNGSRLSPPVQPPKPREKKRR